MPQFYPVFVNVRQRTCVVFGGNHEGERKVRYLLECGANVRLISPERGTTAELLRLAAEKRIAWEDRGYLEGDLEGVWVAIVADTSDGEANERVFEEARERNVLLNVLDVPHLCTFIAPAIIQRKDTTLAVSTAGTSPALARRLREELSDDPKWTRWADAGPILAEARVIVRSKGMVMCPGVWQEYMTSDWLDRAEEDADAARDELVAKLSTRVCEVCVPKGRCQKHG